MAREATGGGEALRALRRHALARDRLGRPAHLRLLLARLAQPRQGRLRRGGRPVVGGLHHHLGPLPAGRAAALADDRRAPGARRSRSASRCASRRRSSSAWPSPSRSAPSPSGARSRTTSCRATRPCTGSSSPPVLAFARQLLRPRLPGRQPALRPLRALSCSPSPRPGSRSRSRSPSGSPAGRPRSRWGSSPRRVLSLDGGPARLRRSSAVPRPRAGAAGARIGRSPSSPSPRAAASPPRCS